MTTLKTKRERSIQRINRLRERVLCPPSICVERGYLVTNSYKETENELPVIRRAKALEKVLTEMTISIEDEELIVGKVTSKRRGSPLIPEVNWKWYLSEMDTVSTRDWDRFAPLSEEEKLKMKEFLPYWEGRSLYDKWHAMVPENAQDLNFAIQAPINSCINNMHLSHNSADYEKVLTLGLNYIRQQVEEELKNVNLAEIKDFNKYQFLKAVNISIEAVVRFAQRYAEMASELANQERDSRRKAELEMIAKTCKWVPANPARSLFEALQSMWFIYVVLMIEGWGAGMSFGRPDQYLYPFYKQDIEAGRITNDEVRELLALLYIKINGLVILVGSEIVRYMGGLGYLSNITLGGITKDGKDAVNELSYLFLEAEKDVRLNSEDLVIRVNSNNPHAFLMKACEVTKLLRGKVKYVSDNTIIQQLLSNGKPIEYARDYIIVGCFTPTVPARSHDIPGSMFNLPLMLELALNNGVSRLSGKQIGPKTGDPSKFTDYQQVWDAYKRQVETLITTAVLFRNVDRLLFAELAPTPFQSALFHGCIEKGIDITSGGTAPYITQSMGAIGAPNVGDSLAAIKKAVFEEKAITMPDLIDALDKNFVNKDKILSILHSTPKFGNDNDYVDSIVNEVLVHFNDQVTKYDGIAKSTTAAMAVTANLPLGSIVGALPDGRKAGEPLSEGGISPYQGRNVNGPTATMRSVASLDHQKLTGGSVLNMRFNPEVLKDEAKMEKFASMIKTYCETGGYLVQFNIVSTDMLRDAQKHPEQYRDLLVRVATYSAYFVELGPELQNDIIARMEYQEI